MCKERESAKILYLEKQRTLFIEAHNKGFTNADIARLIGLSPNYINNVASCSDKYLSGSQMDEFIRKCGLTSMLEADAIMAGYVMYKIPNVESPADVISTYADVTREGSEDSLLFSEILVKLRKGLTLTERDKDTFKKECQETISKRLELIAAVEQL